MSPRGLTDIPGSLAMDVRQSGGRCPGHRALERPTILGMRAIWCARSADDLFAFQTLVGLLLTNGPGAISALAAGMDDCLVKPVQLGLMREKLARWLPLPAAAAAGARVLDADFIAANWGSNPQAIRGIKDAYASNVRDDLRALREGVAQRDGEAVRQVAHRMIGASRMLGADAFGAACERVLAAIREEDWLAVGAAMAALEQEYERLVRELAE